MSRVIRVHETGEQHSAKERRLKYARLWIDQPMKVLRQEIARLQLDFIAPSRIERFERPCYSLIERVALDSAGLAIRKAGMVSRHPVGDELR